MSPIERHLRIFKATKKKELKTGLPRQMRIPAERLPEYLNNVFTPENLIERERGSWRKVFGAEVAIPPLPTEITQGLESYLGRAGFNLVSLPSLNLSENELKGKDPSEYLAELTKIYPNWRAFESLSEEEKNDHRVCRNLRKWFWEEVKKGNIDFPTLPGRWLAVETMGELCCDMLYGKLTVADKIGLSNRFDLPRGEVTQIINRIKPRILLGLIGKANLRLLEAIEWNLLANREGWGQNIFWEHTNTEYRGEPNSRLTVGGSFSFGAARVGWENIFGGVAIGHSGFRVAVVFGV